MGESACERERVRASAAGRTVASSLHPTQRTHAEQRSTQSMPGIVADERVREGRRHHGRAACQYRDVEPRLAGSRRASGADAILVARARRGTEERSAPSSPVIVTSEVQWKQTQTPTPIDLVQS